MFFLATVKKTNRASSSPKLQADEDESEQVEAQMEPDLQPVPEESAEQPVVDIFTGDEHQTEVEAEDNRPAPQVWIVGTWLKCGCFWCFVNYG